MFYLSIVFYTLSLFSIKMTFLAQYYRVLAVSATTKTVYIAAIVLIGCWGLSQTFIGIFTCWPGKLTRWGPRRGRKTGN